MAKKDNGRKRGLLIVAIILIVMIALWFLPSFFAPRVDPSKEITKTIGEVKVEFIPAYINKVSCRTGSSLSHCLINFQIKNVGEKTIYVGVGDFTEVVPGVADITYLNYGGQAVTVAPGEISTTQTVNVYAREGLPPGTYSIKVPLQAYDGSGTRIGEAGYYLTGLVEYS